MLLTAEEAQRRVAKGAAFLDARFPEWTAHVNVQTLDLAVGCSCVLGQLHGDYNTAAQDRRLFPRRWWQGPAVSERQAQAFGFDLHVHSPLSAQDSHDYKLLQDAWVTAIDDRIARYSQKPKTLVVQMETK